jgi:hypothetical protein
MCWFFKKRKAKKQALQEEQLKMQQESMKKESIQKEKPAPQPVETKPVVEPVKKVEEKKEEPKKAEPVKVEDDKEDAKSKNPKYHVSQNKDPKSPAFKQWRVRKEGSNKTIKYFDTQALAIAYAEDLAEKNDTSIVIHKLDGTIRKQDYQKKE